MDIKRQNLWVSKFYMCARNVLSQWARMHQSHIWCVDIVKLSIVGPVDGSSITGFITTKETKKYFVIL